MAEARGVTTSRGVDRFGLVALVGSGTLAAHELGYLADTSNSVSHAYLGVLGPLVGFAACVAAWIAALRVLRNDPGRLPSVTALAALQVAAYLVIEVAERISDGSLGSLASTPVVLGLIAQPVVAVAALRLLGLGRSLIEAFRVSTPRALAARLVVLPAPDNVVVSDVSLLCVRLRGPPV